MNYGCSPSASQPLAASKGLDVTPATALVGQPAQRVVSVPGGALSVEIPERSGRVITVLPLPLEEVKN